MTKRNDLKINILSFVSLNFKDPASTRESGGGWLRFQKILEVANKSRVEYHLVSFRFFQPPIILGIVQTLTSMIKVLTQTCKIVKSTDINLLLCPIEDPWIVMFANFCSKITNRKLVVFLNSIPYFGLTNVPKFGNQDLKVSFKALLKIMRSSPESKARAPVSALFWYISFKVLRSPSTNVVCLNKVLADEFYELTQKRAVSIYPGNGIDFDAISRAKIGNKEFDAIYATGSLLPQKGIFDVIEIWNIVVANRPSARLAIAGRVDPGYLYLIKEIYCMINQLGLSDNITLICDPEKGLSQQELWQSMKQAKVFLYPSQKDVWPLVIGEALGCGLSVIAYELPGIRFAYGDCPDVYLIKVGSVENAAQRAINLLEGDLFQESSKKARQYAENHSWTNVADLEREAYLTIIH